MKLSDEWQHRTSAFDPDKTVTALRKTRSETRVFLVVRPNPFLYFAPFLSTHFFPVFEPHIQKWVIFVRRRPCVYDTFRFESPPPPRKKDRIWHRLPPPPSRGLRQLNFPNVKNDAGQKQYSPCFLRRRRRPKAGDAFTRTRLMPTFGVSAALSVEHCRP